MLCKQKRSRLDVVLLKPGKHHSCRCRCRQAERQKRNERTCSRRIICGFRTCHTFNGTVPKFLGLGSELALDIVAEEGRNFRTASWQGPNREPDRCSTQPRFPRA